MKLLFLAITLLCCTVAHALSPQAEADLLMIEAKKAQDVRDYAAVVKNLSRVAELNVKLPESFPFHFGKALSETGNYARAQAELEKYIAGAGSDGRFYREALEALSRNTTLEADAKRKRLDDQAAMAKYNEALVKYRADQEYYQSVKHYLERCEEKEDKCNNRLGERVHPAYPERITVEYCERERRKCERVFHQRYPNPVQPTLPKLHFAESATQFAARPQPTPTPPVSPTPLNAPVPSGGTTIQAVPAQQAVPAPPRKALEDQVQALVGTWAPDDANCQNSPTIRKIRREGNKLIDEIVERKDGSVVVVRTLEAFAQSNIHTNSGDGLSYRYAGRNHKLNRDMDGVETISIANGSVIQPWSQVLGSDVIVRQGKRADGSPPRGWQRCASVDSPSAPARPATISTALSQDSRLAEKEATYLTNFPGLSSRTADQAVASLGLPAEVSRVTSYHLCPGCRLNVVFHCRSGVAIRNHGDFRALKIRVGQISPANQELASLGASPQMMPLTAVGDAFRQGLLDCVAHEELRGDAGISKPLEKQTIDLEISLPHEGRDLTPAARAELDSFVGKLAGLKLQVIAVVATVDSPDASAAARTRADEVAATVKNYLVGKGVPANLIYAEGKAGEPSPGKASVRVDLQAIGTR